MQRRAVMCLYAAKRDIAIAAALLESDVARRPEADKVPRHSGPRMREVPSSGLFNAGADGG